MYINHKFVEMPEINLDNVYTACTLKKDDCWFRFCVDQASEAEKEFIKDMTEDIIIPKRKAIESIATYVTIRPSTHDRVCTTLMVRITTADGKQYPHCIGFKTRISQEKAIVILKDFFAAGAPGMDAKEANRLKHFFNMCLEPDKKAEQILDCLRSGMSAKEVLRIYG